MDEILINTDKNKVAVTSELARLIDKGEVVNLRQGFYLIIPPLYSNFKKLPLALYADKLFQYLNKKYYVGFYSAAKIYGASHQQSQRDYVMTKTPKLIDIKKETIDLRFFTMTDWPGQNIIQKKSDAGLYNISSPALTFVDMLRYQTKLGGLNRMLASLEELYEEIEESDIKNLLSWYDHKSTLQRFGYILDEIDMDSQIASLVYQKFKTMKSYPILLYPNKNEKPGSAKNRWKVDVNIKLESDL
jgi:predicted transcriptional regulator of viral defense system